MDGKVSVSGDDSFHPERADTSSCSMCGVSLPSHMSVCVACLDNGQAAWTVTTINGTTVFDAETRRTWTRDKILLSQDGHSCRDVVSVCCRAGIKLGITTDHRRILQMMTSPRSCKYCIVSYHTSRYDHSD
eukprot:g25690.t1